jgi:hypothetical protein
MRLIHAANLHLQLQKFPMEMLNPEAAFSFLAVTGYYYAWCRTKHPMQSGHFLISCAVHLISNHSRFNYQSSLLWLQETPNSNAERNWARSGR